MTAPIWGGRGEVMWSVGYVMAEYGIDSIHI